LRGEKENCLNALRIADAGGVDERKQAASKEAFSSSYSVVHAKEKKKKKKNKNVKKASRTFRPEGR